MAARFYAEEKAAAQIDALGARIETLASRLEGAEG